VSRPGAPRVGPAWPQSHVRPAAPRYHRPMRSRGTDGPDPLPGLGRPRGRLAFERACYERGFRLVAGVDEAGRGPLAGPVVAAAVVLPTGVRLPGVTDSKRLDPETRARLLERIEARALALGVGVVGPEEIDRVNILRASLRAMAAAIAALACPRTGAPLAPEFVLVDGVVEVPGLDRQWAIPQADARSLTVGAASIVAKVTRDRLMAALDREHPDYGFARHKGYPTPEHLEAIRRHGVSPVHRRTFHGVREYCPEWSAAAAQPTLFGGGR
jgi:ribonuclease HII